MAPLFWEVQNCSSHTTAELSSSMQNLVLMKCESKVAPILDTFGDQNPTTAVCFLFRTSKINNDENSKFSLHQVPKNFSNLHEKSKYTIDTQVRVEKGRGYQNSA